MAEDATAGGIGESDFSKMATLDAGDAVVFCELAVEEAKVGSEEFFEGEVLVEQVGEEVLGFDLHGVSEIVAVVVSEVGRRWHSSDVVKFEPDADKVANEALCFWVIEHAVNLGVQDFGLVEAVALGDLDKFIVGHRGPEKIGEPGSEGVGIEVALVFFHIKETWGTKNGLEAKLEGF